MKKPLRTTAFLLLITALATLASLTGPARSFTDRVDFEVSAGLGLRQKGIKPVDFAFKTFVNFVDPAYLFVTVEENLALFKRAGNQNYLDGVSIGGGLGVRLLHRPQSAHALDLRAKALSSVGSPDWERTTYDLAAAWYLRSHRFSPVVELGYRYLNSRTQGFTDYGNAYLSIGFRF